VKKTVWVWSLRPPNRPEYREVLPLAGEILRSRRYRGRVDPERWDPESLIGYWALRLIGASRIPVEEGEYTLEELGFYRFEEYSRLGVARTPLDLPLAGRPTPVVRVSLWGRGPEAWFKLEWYNPYSLSIKDRVAWMMVREALEEGRLGNAIVEASSSNTGIALAALAGILGIRARIYLPRTAPMENVRVLRLLGAEVVFTESLHTTEIAGRAVRDVESGYIHLDQFNNDANLEAHMRYTAREYHIQLEEAGARPTVLVVASGTSGTASALAFFFNHIYNGVRTFVVVPRRGEVIEGIRRLETGVKWLDGVGVEYSIVEVSRREALEGMRLLARRAGLVPGVSGGAVVGALARLVGEGLVGEEDVVASVIPDTGFKYPGAVAEAVGENGL